METLQKTEISAEKATLYGRIICATPEWLEARAAAERDGHMNVRFNLRESDAMAFINEQLEAITELNLLPEDYGE